MSEELAEKPRQFQFAFREWLPLVWRRFLDALAPPRCLACGVSIQEPAAICGSCLQKLAFLDDPVCDVMGTAFPYDPGEGVLSAQALSHPPAWDRSRAAVVFDDLSKVFVHAFKYGDRNEAGLFMARLMLRAGQPLLPEVDLVVPVPLHWRRLWKRRFNQAAFLAQQVARGADKPFEPLILRRQRATPPQVGLDAAARARNMRRAFCVQDGTTLTGQCVLLVDDVRTTGATTTACVDTLKKAGAARVHVLTFALVNAPFRPHIDI